MNDKNTISPEKVKEVISKGWMTHDAMWFFSTMQKLGVQTANELNLSAISLMAPIETKRMLKALGMKDVKIDSFDKLWSYFLGARQMVIFDWMDYQFERSGENSFRWRWNTCFAYQGVSQLGILGNYQCGVMYRIECWLKAMGLKYEMDPQINGCLMHNCGKCEGEFRFDFE